MLVLFRSFYRGGKGFQARARARAPAGRWTSWGSWTPCTASCGACGTRMRTSTCPQGSACPGSPYETEVCNDQPCSGLCAKKRQEDGECSGFLALLRGQRCKTERTVMEPCQSACCPGFFVRGGRCSR